MYVDWSDKAMIRVELIGANAVGKTTLLRQAGRNGNQAWLPVKQA